MLYVSLHDGEQGKRNVAAYGDAGGLIVATVLIGPLPPEEAELRGLSFVPSGPESMWVLNGASKTAKSSASPGLECLGSPSSSQAPLASSTFEVLPEPEFIMYGPDGP
jgi:hypothetical protein